MHPVTDPHTAPHPRSTVLAALAVAVALLVVPASLPLCAMEMEACSVDVPAVPAGAHCPMDTAGFGEMSCCVEDATPQAPAPAVPGKADAERQLQSTPALAPAAVDLASTAFPASAPVVPEAADLAASPVPLYTLLSSLLS